MDNLPKTSAELLEKLKVKNIEHVADIGSDKHYGLSVSGTVGSEEVSVLGSVVLDRGTGEPEYKNEATSFVAFPDGLTEGGVTIVEGAEAVETMRQLYNTHGSGEPFVPESEAEIDPLAR